MTAALRHRVRTFAHWLALAIVLTCALGSFGSPVRASSGSAFNAFTSDVAIGPSRAATPEKVRQEQVPPSGGAGEAKAASALSATLIPPSLAAAKAYAAPAATFVPTAFAGPVGARAPPLS